MERHTIVNMAQELALSGHGFHTLRGSPQTQLDCPACCMEQYCELPALI